MVVGGKWPLPEQCARGHVDAHDFALSNRDDLARPDEVRDDWRAVPRTVTGPPPLHSAGGHVERGECARLVAAQVKKDRATIDDR
ncbi:hypothetical protein D3C83_127350 [compost metagenome]